MQEDCPEHQCEHNRKLIVNCNFRCRTDAIGVRKKNLPQSPRNRNKNQIKNTDSLRQQNASCQKRQTADTAECRKMHNDRHAMFMLPEIAQQRIANPLAGSRKQCTAKRKKGRIEAWIRRQPAPRKYRKQDRHLYLMQLFLQKNDRYQCCKERSRPQDN